MNLHALVKASNSARQEALRRKLNQLSPRIRTLPIVVLMPHEGCNARCIMCDIWRSNERGIELSIEDLRPHLPGLRRLHPQRFVLTGGEALLHRNFSALCALLSSMGAPITLLSTGISMTRESDSILEWIDDVIVSLDGPPPIHDAIRRVPRAFHRLRDGVYALKAKRPTFRVTARSVIQKRNFERLEETIETARDLGLDRISFLALDSTSQAFARNQPDPSLGLTVAEVRSFETMVEDLLDRRHDLFEVQGGRPSFVAESPEKMRRLVAYFWALVGDRPFPEPNCNAPWVSVVVEANGDVRPCFFQPSFGNLAEGTLSSIVDSDRARAFRKSLNVKTDPTCVRCVCSLSLGPFSVP